VKERERKKEKEREKEKEKKVLLNSMFYTARKLVEKCRNCNFCKTSIACAKQCIGCGACVAACPYSARVLEESLEERAAVKIKVDGESFELPERITILKALEILGYEISSFPSKSGIAAPCKTGGCWSCAVLVNGKLRPSCITAIEDGMEIITDRDQINKQKPLRLVSGFQGHAVGGVGTPYYLKGKASLAIEVACFAHGCILRCPTCQNWEVTYSSKYEPMTPMQAARVMTQSRLDYVVDRMAISGGECTLNRRWLVEYIKELKKLNLDGRARIHVDTNAVVLTPDYLDELVEGGMTDIGIDVKGLELETFSNITGIKDAMAARKMLEMEWEALKYMLDNYKERVFIGVGIPYNSAFITLDEVYNIGIKIASLDPEVQVVALDYRPEFRRMDIKKPNYLEMKKIKKTLESAGLRCVICQTEYGYIGP
jgi:pyruvate formate lyase activating enzyme